MMLTILASAVTVVAVAVAAVIPFSSTQHILEDLNLPDAFLGHVEYVIQNYTAPQGNVAIDGHSLSNADVLLLYAATHDHSMSATNDQLRIDLMRQLIEHHGADLRSLTANGDSILATTLDSWKHALTLQVFLIFVETVVPGPENCDAWGDMTIIMSSYAMAQRWTAVGELMDLGCPYRPLAVIAAGDYTSSGGAIIRQLATRVQSDILLTVLSLPILNNTVLSILVLEAHARGLGTSERNAIRQRRLQLMDMGFDITKRTQKRVWKVAAVLPSCSYGHFAYTYAQDVAAIAPAMYEGFTTPFIVQACTASNTALLSLYAQLGILNGMTASEALNYTFVYHKRPEMVFLLSHDSTGEWRFDYWDEELQSSHFGMIIVNSIKAGIDAEDRLALSNVTGAWGSFVYAALLVDAALNDSTSVVAKCAALHAAGVRAMETTLRRDMLVAIAFSAADVEDVIEAPFDGSRIVVAVLNLPDGPDLCHLTLAAARTSNAHFFHDVSRIRQPRSRHYVSYFRVHCLPILESSGVEITASVRQGIDAILS